ncbi:N4-(beta-N-acetylglucosaminyl)-L-asparaginase [Chryseobacterium piscicola]|uniref:Glycosylasparaginase n=1 Tax=Chryseobacterium piscicola TaxID=551459 RepID=A0A1N7NW60_9FLAO|nr:N(4)-(beta-N-acetylglucosaminyl)-L-asparaginase [Chryseobacterium piscicola]PQA94200.1 glycosylasparaginase [Chryseobacterium piscicola]SIT02521.1 N4-(beta-N-acetylglucosaminyl)-L-asparaginase [Chryseobacterium piscicola]
MNSRRKFLKTTGILSSALLLNPLDLIAKKIPESENTFVNKPIVLSTWDFGLKANKEAWTILGKGGRALDAVEKGVRLVENDPNERSVGYGGRPDRDGRVTLDACIMDENYNIGSVACLENIKNPISVARMVMEKTPHVMLVGDGAFQFAVSQGFKKENILTAESEKEWKEWLKDSKYKPIVNIENHDTIGMIALDAHGNLSGACTTSGMAFKMHGRVGDSPIIGAGLFVDNEVGAATATGHGEEMIRTVGTHLVVELMRQGRNPQQACKEAVERIVKITERRNKNLKDIQVGFIAINKKGEYGSYCIQDGFNFAVYDQKGNRLEKPEFALK